MTRSRQDSAIREAAVAGLFYPGDPRELRSSVENLLANARATHKAGRVRALIAPHAGYVYSGAVAAEAFAALRTGRRRFRRVVIIGPAHRMWWFRGVAAPAVSAFATPLGVMPIDAAAIQQVSALPSVVIDDDPHAGEHALEVELPFLQTVFGSIPIAPLLVGDATSTEVGEVLNRLWNDDTLIVISSDLSHFSRYGDSRCHDLVTAEAIERFDESAIGFKDACGAVPVRGLLIEAARRGFSIERLDLRNSGDTVGDRSQVVGYGAWAIRDRQPTSA